MFAYESAGEETQYTDIGPEQPNMCEYSHNVPFSAKWLVHLQTY